MSKEKRRVAVMVTPTTKDILKEIAARYHCNIGDVIAEIAVELYNYEKNKTPEPFDTKESSECSDSEKIVC